MGSQIYLFFCSRWCVRRDGQVKTRSTNGEKVGSLVGSGSEASVTGGGGWGTTVYDKILIFRKIASDGWGGGTKTRELV